MKTKNTKRTFIIFQILAVIFLLLGFAGRILQNQDYDLLLFGRPILFQAFMICFLIFYFIEALTIWRLFEKIKKKLLFITYLIFIPLIVFQLFALWFSSSSDVSIKMHKYPEFDTTIVIENGSDLFGGYSQIYETKNKILLRDIALLDGDPNPLGYEALDNVEIKNNKIIYTYNDDSEETGKNQLILEYENGHFKEVTD